MFPLHILFLCTLFLGSFIAISSNSWLVAWIGLEVNLLSMLPIMAWEKSKSSSESCMKYFLIQSMASLLILISSVFVFYIIMMNSTFMIFFGLVMKLGAAPFHYWFPSVMEGINWVNCMLLMTWQKLAPLFLMSFVDVILAIILITSLVGAIGGFGQFSLKSIMAYSSINHVGWMLAGILWSTLVSITYYVIYFIMSLLVVSFFSIYKLFHVFQFASISYFLKIMVLVNFLSLGGLPPFLGFFPKWLIIEKLLWSSIFLSMVLIFSSLVSLYFYLRLTYFGFFLKFFSSETVLGETIYVSVPFAFFFLSSGGVFCYPLLSLI